VFSVVVTDDGVCGPVRGGDHECEERGDDLDGWASFSGFSTCLSHFGVLQVSRGAVEAEG